ncbi:2,3-diketo-L-gulonate reductase [Citrobacter koseri]|uniref:2,3-diketo-L-gulonate reductase n=1 Tax=Citrobacter koseri TaxID=545 RepID=A0A447UMU7_CITKO|nr:2,3-diketo-L-gulonate reductase [Citrobacter koseri]
MKVTFEQLKEAFNRVLLARGVAVETADACAEMFARNYRIRRLFAWRESLSPFHSATG